MVYNEYIALAQPNEAAELCKQYGLDCKADDPQGLSECLAYIVEQSGETGLKDVMSIHPDRKVIVELADNAKKKHRHNFNGMNSCGECNAAAQMLIKSQEYPLGRGYSATGVDSAAATNNAIQNQTAVILHQHTQQLIFLTFIVIAGILIYKK